MKKFTENIINSFGAQGEVWLTNLPNLVHELGEYWNLKNIIPVKNLSWNYVATAIQKTNSPVVLKISCDKELIIDEYQALNHFNGTGAIHVIDINHQYNALLLERATPGKSLKNAPQIAINESIKIYAEIIKQLAEKPAPRNYPTKHVSNWLTIIDTLTDVGIEKPLINKAQKIKHKLLSSLQREYLCHGDLHLENIINNGANWVAIDPKGVIGEIAFEAAAFDILSRDEIKDKNCSVILIERAIQLAKQLDIHQERLLSWIFLKAIISALWFIEDKGDPQFMQAIASLIYPLI